MPHDYVLKNLMFDTYGPPKCDLAKTPARTRGHRYFIGRIFDKPIQKFSMLPFISQEGSSPLHAPSSWQVLVKAPISL